ncbi:MAG: HD-GYP domain-containing protein, partial [Acidimicrobiales bacterium]|nr:HD-GYP domain-containing protein [Acidimicrobiales bacterium]
MNSRTRIDAATGAPNAGWSRRKGLALAVRVAIVVVPFVGAWIAIRLTQRWYYHPEGWPGVVIWVVQAAAVGLLASRAISLYSRRLTPLVALFEMTLVFPDYAPSRFGVALRAGSVGKLLRQPELRLSEDAQEAAEQAVQLVAHLRRHEPLTRGHTERVRAYAELIGEEMGLDEADLNRLRWGALLHDVGKLAVPESILNKKGLPTRDEWEILRNHPVAGAKLLEPLHEWLGEWVRAASEHHEWWDGNGYPAGLRGEEISLSGRITAVADAYDVITSRRSYKDPLSAERAREELVAAAGTQFDPAVVRAMLQVGLRPGARAGWLAWIFELPGLAPLAG